MNKAQLPRSSARRAAIRRTVWVLVAFALTGYGLFLYGAMSAK